MNLRKRDGRSEQSLNDKVLVMSSDKMIGNVKLKGDRRNIAILFFLYLLQGIPLGLMQAVPILLTNAGVSYKQQATFSLVYWPFSLKLLWAPVLDCLYWKKFGRRKSWLVPTQYLIGILMLLLSQFTDDLLGNSGKEPRMELLAFSFFCLNFLAATQDIAVDGWALTMLKRENVGYASTCNSVGQTAGYFLGYVSFLALESASFCNTYLRNEPSNQGLLTLPDFLWFWGWVFLFTTTLIWVFKSEKSEHVEENITILGSYKLLLEVFKLKPIRLLAFILLTAKIGFSACDVVTGLKLIEAGIPKEKIALLAIPLVPLQVILPLLLSKYVAGKNPMGVYLTAYPYRLICGIFISIFVAITPYFLTNNEISTTYFIIIILLYSLHQVTVYSMFVAQMAFFAKISDPTIGGTYMTLVNTLANIGGTWPQTLALWFVDFLTIKKCTLDESISCKNPEESEMCQFKGGVCTTKIDGYYIETVLCTIIGIIWFLWGKKSIKKLLQFEMSSFSVQKVKLGARRK